MWVCTCVHISPPAPLPPHQQHQVQNTQVLILAWTGRYWVGKVISNSRTIILTEYRKGRQKGRVTQPCSVHLSQVSKKGQVWGILLARETYVHYPANSLGCYCSPAEPNFALNNKLFETVSVKEPTNCQRQSWPARKNLGPKKQKCLGAVLWTLYWMLILNWI